MTKGGKHPFPVSQGLIYRLLSRARKRSVIQILNFHKDKIKHIKEALKEVECMRRDCHFVYEHALEKLHDGQIFLK